MFILIKGTYTGRFAMTLRDIIQNIDNNNVNKILVYVDNSTNEIIIKKVEIYSIRSKNKRMGKFRTKY